MPKFLTEDEVRDNDKRILGFDDGVEQNVQQGTGQLTTFNQLGLKGISDKFDNMQLYQIKLGLDSKVDVKVYAKPIYTWKQMQYIRYGLEEGLDIEYYSVPNFSAYQMHLIYKGLLVGLDVEKCAISGYDWTQMCNIMNCNIKELCTKYQLDSMQETELRMAIDSGHHISNFLDHGYTGEEMREIRLKLNKMSEDDRL